MVRLPTHALTFHPENTNTAVTFSPQGTRLLSGNQFKPPAFDSASEPQWKHLVSCSGLLRIYL